VACNFSDAEQQIPSTDGGVGFHTKYMIGPICRFVSLN